MLKFLTKLDYLLRETFLGLRRGGWLNWAAVSTVTVLLFLFGICLQTSWQLDALVSRFGSQVEISVYLQSQVVATKILPQVEKISGVKKVTTISKEKAWSQLVAEMGIADLEQVTQQLDGNPLVDELKVSVKTTEMLPQVAASISKISGVDEVIYLSEAWQRLQQLRQGLNWISLSITSVLSLTAIAVIMTTLRLIAIARRQEIEILHLVGATKRWIYLPFILQGISFGLIGGVIAWTLINSLSNSLQGLLANQPEFLQFINESLKLDFSQTIMLAIFVLGLGVAIGLAGSLFALRRLVFK